MKVSIIVPIYNVSQYVEVCLSSVAAQSWDGRIECIIIDDCGTDDSMEKVEKFVATYDGTVDFKILHHEKNRGLSAARNTGMTEATGDYFFFLDSDDYISADCLERLAAPIVNVQYDLVVGNWSFSGEDSPINTLADGEYNREQIIQAFLKHNFQIAVWNKLYSASFLKNNNLLFLEGVLHEDVLFSSEVVTLVDSMYFVNSCTYHYTFGRDSSIMSVITLIESIANYRVMYRQYANFLNSSNLWWKTGVNDLVQYFFKLATRGYGSTFSIFLQCRSGWIGRYKENRRIIIKSWRWYYYGGTGNSYRRLLRGLHYIFPPSIGVLIYFLINVIRAAILKYVCKKWLKWKRFESKQRTGFGIHSSSEVEASLSESICGKNGFI